MFANYILFRRLFNYINGANERVSKFNMTVPVLMKSENNQKTMMFYLGKGSFPQPTQKEVKLQTTKEHKVFVRVYESFWFFGEEMNEKKLKNALEKENAKFKSNYYYSVGYSRPMYFRKSYKEIWYAATDADI
ncbi:uncharacterized protein LOC115226083 [Octopus sinensis]|uniref:Uncharacterized protein LOC115226083 n=1 Tax=Octopus sinensis TaxID=2607531 RepID=A0A6P7TSQ2_9MOLL|nr:uncharacterized protein LOC115226083 [Octopus sinensis]